MLDTREKLKDCLKKEKEFYITRKSRHDQMVEWVVKDPCVRIWQYQKVLRYTELLSKGIKKINSISVIQKKKKPSGSETGHRNGGRFIRTGTYYTSHWKYCCKWICKDW